MAISIAVRQCLEAFENIQIRDSDLQWKSKLLDELGRFRTWAGNVSAHRTGRRSLEYRLRDASNLQAAVQSLLWDLRQSLGTVKAELTSQMPALSSGEEQDRTASTEDDDGDANEAGDDALFEIDDEEGPAASPIEQGFDELHEVITCLLRFSMTLRHPARHDQIKQHTTSIAIFYEPKDIEHVATKHPGVPQYLSRRIGKTISKHRQYFKYRVEHHEKLTAGLGGEDADDRPSTVATSLRPAAISHEIDLSAIDTDGESVYTATSYAPTLSDETILRPPPWPEAAHDGEPFECPICYNIIVASSERSWRQHVFEDLPPYVCTLKDCSRAGRPFCRRREWQQHQANMHNRSWLCPFGCAESIRSAALFEQHLEYMHYQGFEPNALQRIVNSCAQVHESVGPMSCVICGKTKPTAKLLHKHLGHHLEQLALFALPHHLLAEESGDESGNDLSRDDNRVSDDSDEELDIDASNEDYAAGHVLGSLRGTGNCYCNRSIIGPQIPCANNTCPRQWFHLACVGLTERDLDPIKKWYCDECHALINKENKDAAELPSVPPSQQTQSHANESIPRGASSYWSASEQTDFIKYIAHFGTDFAAIAAHMGTKTQTMIKNHYLRQISGNQPDLQHQALAADRRKEAGEELGPPPTPTPIVKRKYSDAQPIAPRRLAPYTEALNVDVIEGYGSAYGGGHSSTDSSDSDDGIGYSPALFRTADGVLIRKDGRPDMRSVISQPEPMFDGYSNATDGGHRNTDISDNDDGIHYNQALPPAGKTPESGRTLKQPNVDRGRYSPPPSPGLSGKSGRTELQTTADPEATAAVSTKRHQCPYCSTDFTRHHNLLSHLLTHRQEKPYLCQTCDVRFRRLHDLKRHAKLHVGERPHVCDTCGRKFARRDALARHKKGPGGCAGRRSSFGGDDEALLDNAEYTGVDDKNEAQDA